MRLVLIDDAIRALHPDAQFTTVNEVITEWNSSGITQPTQEELNAKLIELKAAEPMKLLRQERDKLIAETDWTQLKDISLIFRNVYILVNYILSILVGLNYEKSDLPTLIRGRNLLVHPRRNASTHYKWPCRSRTRPPGRWR